MENGKLTNGNLEIGLISLISEMGTFKFCSHWSNPTQNFYDALTQFEANNWETLGETKYIIYVQDAEPVEIAGNNASARLSAFMEDFN